VRSLEYATSECEPPAAYLPLVARTPSVTVRAWGRPAAEHHRFAAIIAMGARMGVNDRAELPWIDTRYYLREATEAGDRYGGVCLGAQLLQYGIQFHLEADAALAAVLEIPAYRESRHGRWVSPAKRTSSSGLRVEEESMAATVPTRHPTLDEAGHGLA